VQVQGLGAVAARLGKGIQPAVGRAEVTVGVCLGGEVAEAPGGRVSRAGAASGAGPFQLVAGALDDLDDNDRAAVSLLPG
jgi:hypothetical protein